MAAGGTEGGGGKGRGRGAGVGDVEGAVVGGEGETVGLLLGVVEDVDGAGKWVETEGSARELGGGGYEGGAGGVGVV